MDYYIHLAILVGIYLILAHGFHLSFGLGKLLNLAHIAVFSIGSYTTALFAVELEKSFWFCVPASISLSALFALLIGAISIKLRQDYFAIGTLAFAAIVNALLVNWKSLTRGVLGIPGIPRPDIFGINFYENSNFLILVFVCAGFILTLNYIISTSAFARSLQAQAENEYAAMALGKDIRSIKNDCFILSSAYAGLAGSLFAYYLNYIDPSSFNLSEMVFVLSIVVVGKPGSFWGVTAATVFLILLPEPLRFLEIPSSILGPMRQMIHAIILFSVVYWKRDVLFPFERRV